MGRRRGWLPSVAKEGSWWNRAPRKRPPSLPAVHPCDLDDLRHPLQDARWRRRSVDMPRVVRGEACYDLGLMQSEVEIARAICPFEKGPYKNAISLPSAEQVYAPYRTHHNSVPFSGALDHCPYLKSIFDSFQTEKVAFRLLRRVARAAYSFHDDRDRGRSIARFQIPISTSDHAFLLIARD